MGDSQSKMASRTLLMKFSVYFAVMILVMSLPMIGIKSYHLSVATEIMVFSIMAMGLDLLVGFTGLVSLGHAAFFAVAAYTAGITAKHISTEVSVVFSFSIFVTGLSSLIIGWLSLRMAGFYFLMVTFAFAQIIYSVADRWKWLTGGTDGLLVPSCQWFGTPIFNSPVKLYYVAAVAFILTWLVLRRIVVSPFGQVLVGIRENANRMASIGYNVRRYKLAAFILSAFFAGLSGVLNVQFNLFVSPHDAHWILSAIVLVMVLIGGAGTLTGPILGTALYMYFQNLISSYTEYWSFVIGVLFIALITGARKGLLGILYNLSRAFLKRVQWIRS